MPSTVFVNQYQMVILNRLLCDSEFIGKYRTILKSEFFNNACYVILVNIVFNFFDQYGNAPTRAELIQEIKLLSKEKINYLKQNGIDTPKLKELLRGIYNAEVGNDEYSKKIIIEFARTKAFEQHVLTCASNFNEHKTTREDIGQMVKQAEDIINIGSSLEDQGHFVLDPAVIEARIKLRQEGTRRRTISTGIEALDGIMEGGLDRPEMGVLMAPSGKGKSLALVCFGRAAILSGFNVFHYTFEMTEEKVANRYDASILGVDYHKLNQHDDPLVKRLQGIREKYNKHLLVKFFPYQNASVLDIKAHIKSVKSTMGIDPDMLILDYGDIMIPAYGTYKERRHQKGAIFNEINSLANELEVAIWVATQTNRASVNRELITIADIAESFEPIQVAPVVLTLCQTQEEEVDNAGRFYLAKMRDAEDHKFIFLKLEKSKMNVYWDRDRQLNNDADNRHLGNAEVQTFDDEDTGAILDNAIEEF